MRSGRLTASLDICRSFKVLASALVILQRHHTRTMSFNSPLQLLFLGTGTSTGLPLTPCLTLSHPYPEQFNSHVPLPPPSTEEGAWDPDGEWPDTIPCACCRSSVSPKVPEGWKNKRGNTSAVVRKKGSDGRWRNVVVDVGKTFVEQARRFFPRWGVKTIDAVLLTHGRGSIRSPWKTRLRSDRRRCLLWPGRSARMVYPPTHTDSDLPRSADIRERRRKLSVSRRQDKSFWWRRLVSSHLCCFPDC